MTEAQITDAIIKSLKRIAPEVDSDTLAPDENVREIFDIDSYDFLVFLVGLDEELGLEIPEADYGQLVSLDDLTKYLTVRVP